MERKRDIGNSIMGMAKLQNRGTINSIEEKSIGIFTAQTAFESKKAIKRRQLFERGNDQLVVVL